MKNERTRGLNRNLNDGWYFRKLEVILQVGGDFATWFATGFAAVKLDFEVAKWHTCV